MNSFFRAAALAGGLLAAPAATAQPLGGWATYVLQVRPEGSPVAAFADARARGHGLTGDLDQLFLRAGVQWSVPGTRLTLSQGGGYVRAGPPGPGPADTGEVRVYQDARLSPRVGRVQADLGVRIEQRWVDGDPLQLRGRYLVGGTLPVRGGSRAGGVYANGSAEVFLRGPGRRDAPRYDRTRISTALGVRATDNLRVQVGPVWQVRSGRPLDTQIEVSVRQAISF